MKLLLMFLSVFLLSACATSNTALRMDTETSDHSESGTILVTVNLNQADAFNGAPSRIFNYGDNYGRNVQASRTLRALSRDYHLVPLEVWPIRSLGVVCQVFTAPKNELDDVLRRLKADPRVDLAQAMNDFNTLSTADPYRNVQDNLDQLRIDDVHEFSTGRNVKIAVIDTHIDTDHPELANRIALQRSTLTRAPKAPDAHGTAVAGIIAARSRNGQGIKGIAPDASIVALTACWAVTDAPGRCNSFTLARALDLAMEYQANIINLSFSGPPDALLSRLVQQAVERNVFLVGAYDPSRADAFPSAVSGVIAVATRASLPDIIGAPGEDVLTTAPGGRYDFFTGNSFAAAHISGIAALAFETKPDLDATVLGRVLLDTASNSETLDACAMLSALNNALLCRANAKTTIP